MVEKLLTPGHNFRAASTQHSSELSMSVSVSKAAATVKRAIHGEPATWNS